MDLFDEKIGKKVIYMEENTMMIEHIAMYVNDL